MKVFVSFLISSLFIILFVEDVKAIIIIPAIILLPIVKLVAIIISGFTLPIIGITTYIHKTSNKPIAKGVLVGITILIVLAALVAVILKFLNPSRPLF